MGAPATDLSPPGAKKRELACKPGSVPRQHVVMVIPLGAAVTRALDAAYPGVTQATLEPAGAGPALLLYLALLPVGFAEPVGRPTAGALLPHLFTLA
ncbi:hypothetical protein HRbin36_02618 [bacterium HR36]|nr:hypothetical protein HRbin36_02618 [bacterium HR36]